MLLVIVVARNSQNSVQVHVAADKFIAPHGGCWLLTTDNCIRAIPFQFFALVFQTNYITNGLAQNNYFFVGRGKKIFIAASNCLRMVYEAVSLHRVSRTKWNSYVNYVAVRTRLRMLGTHSYVSDCRAVRKICINRTMSPSLQSWGRYIRACLDRFRRGRCLSSPTYLVCACLCNKVLCYRVTC